MRFKLRLKCTAAALSVVIWAALTVSPASAADGPVVPESGRQPSELIVPGIAPEPTTQGGDTGGEPNLGGTGIASGSWPYLGCHIYGSSDHIHDSRNPPGDVAVKAFWDEYSIDACPNIAYVRVDLEAYYCFSDHSYCWYESRGTRTSQVRQEERVSLHVTCDQPSVRQSWRSVVSVKIDVPGFRDIHAGPTETHKATLNCSVSH